MIGRFGEDRRWLAVLAAMTLAELLWWAIAHGAGIAPMPWVGSYVALAFAGCAAALGLRALIRPGAPRAGWPAIVVGTLLVGLGGSLFLPLQYAIPGEMAFWLDAPLAAGERALFGADPWLLLDRALGWATLPLDRVYGLWLPCQLLVLFGILLMPPSRAKSRALIAYSLAWFLLGVAAAALCSSAGPIFYDRLSGGARFAGLGATLHARGATMAIAESDAMWASLATAKPNFVAGISAMPSLHVAVSLWIWLAARSLAPRLAPLALGYFGLIWVGSVQLGWHYVADGLAGAVGMALLWALSGLAGRARHATMQ